MASADEMADAAMQSTDRLVGAEVAGATINEESLSRVGLLFAMQAGLALIEAGSLRFKNCKFPFYRLLVIMSFGSVSWNLFGHRIANGPRPSDNDIALGETGGSAFWATNAYVALDKQGSGWEEYMVDMLMAMVLTQISQMGLGGRTKLGGYLCNTVFQMALFAPVIIYNVKTFSTGCVKVEDGEGGYNIVCEKYGSMLRQLEFYRDDCTGVMFIFAGVNAFIGAMVTGPRENRWRKPAMFAPQDFSTMGLGIVVAGIGLTGFFPREPIAAPNTTTTPSPLATEAEKTAAALDINIPITDVEYRAQSVVNTLISAGASAVMAFLMARALNGEHNAPAFMQGSMAGFLSSIPSTNKMDMQYHMLTGAIAGASYFAIAKLMTTKLLVDSPCAAFPVYGWAVTLGLIARGLFDFDEGLLVGTHAHSEILVDNMQAAAMCYTFAALAGVMGVLPLLAAEKLRMHVAHERVGMDALLVGETAVALDKAEFDEM